MKYLLKNGTVISGAGTRKQDVLVEGEKIIKVGEELSQPDAKVVDVSGKLLFPGFIDGHTHFDLEVAGTVTADDFETGTRAAILGGTTLVIDFASQDKGGHTLKEGLEKWHKKTDAKYKNSGQPNPHAQHDGALPCTECHKGHKASVNYCAQCHSFVYKVP